MDWDIGKSSLACVACGREFAEEQKVFSALYDESVNLARKDYCSTCWPQQETGAAFSFWQTAIPGRDAPVRRFVNDEIVLDLFRRLSGQDNAERRNFRYVLALLLMRRKVLKFRAFRREEGGDVLVVYDRLGDCEHAVLDPRLTEEQIQQVTEEVGQVLNTKV